MLFLNYKVIDRFYRGKSMVSLKEYQDEIERLELYESNISNRHILKKYSYYQKITNMRYQLDSLYNNCVEFFDLKKVYQELVRNVSCFFKQLGVVKPVEILALYSYLIKNGFLSFDHRFYYRKDVDDCLYLLGVNVVYGGGVCRHITSFLTDIYKELGYSSYNISMVSEELESLSRQNYYVVNVSNNKSFISKLVKRMRTIYYQSFYNHLITLVNDQNGSLFMDPTNDVVLFVNNYKKVLPVLGERASLDCNYLSFFNDEEISYFSSLLIPTDLDSIVKVKDDYNKIWDLALEYHNLFEYFYYDCMSLYEDIMDKRKILLKESKRYILK